MNIRRRGIGVFLLPSLLLPEMVLAAVGCGRSTIALSYGVADFGEVYIPRNAPSGHIIATAPVRSMQFGAKCATGGRTGSNGFRISASEMRPGLKAILVFADTELPEYPDIIPPSTADVSVYPYEIKVQLIKDGSGEIQPGTVNGYINGFEAQWWIAGCSTGSSFSDANHNSAGDDCTGFSTGSGFVGGYAQWRATFVSDPLTCALTNPHQAVQLANVFTHQFSGSPSAVIPAGFFDYGFSCTGREPAKVNMTVSWANGTEQVIPSTGTTGNLGIQLLRNGVKVMKDQPLELGNLVAGSVPFTVEYIRTGALPTAGDFRAIANITLDYE